MKLLLIFILCSAFIAFKPSEVAESIVRRPEKVTAAAAVQQVGSTDGGGSTTFNVTVTSTGVNNLVVVTVSTSTSQTISSVTDNQSNTYTLSSPVIVSSLHFYQAYGIQTTGGVTTVTITKSSTSGCRIVVNEFSGTATSSVYDNQSTGTGTGTSCAVSSFSPGAAGKLVVASVVKASSAEALTAGTSYTTYGTSNNITSAMYRLSSSTSETAPGSWTTSAAWGEIATSFNLAAAPTNTGGFFNFFKP